MTDLFTEPPPRRKVSIEEQIAAVNREISLREAVYTKMIVSGKLTRAKADRQIGEMQAILDTLIWVRDNRAAIVEAATQSRTKPTQRVQREKRF